MKCARPSRTAESINRISYKDSAAIKNRIFRHG